MTLTYLSTTVTLTGREAPRIPLDIQPDRQQNVGEVESGGLEVYDRNVTIWTATFTVHVTWATMVAVRDFFNKTVKGSMTSFTVTPDSEVDLGTGKGTAITANLIGKLPPCRIIAPPAIWEQKFTLRWLSTGTGNPS